MSEFASVSYPVARKEHICELCGKIINQREKYEKHSGQLDGKMFSLNLHILCADIIKQYCEWAEDNDYCNEEVITWLRETCCYECQNSLWNNDVCKIDIFCCDKALKKLKGV